jgi:transcriptional regulator with GAF, ATPase, and Fis domain
VQNFIERSVILTPGSVLRVQAKELQLASPVVAASGGTLEDIEREHILQVLRETGGVVGGRHGAALRLGLKRSTLLSKMRRIGISHDRKNITVALHDRARYP